ncbi:MAG: HAD family hydrolase [Verrucomicrobiae bacterium]|nr:HAD family hydrolase [Verrucomicrobiae bacterium]
MPTTCLFDLDGTLSDPKPGITGCIQYALETLQQPVPTKDELEWAIGPPLLDTFLTLLNGDEAAAARGLSLYRERFGTLGMYENELYPGIPECLGKLTEAGMQLFVATSKPHFYAKPITEHFGINHIFKHVHGSEMSGERIHKTDLLAYILEVEKIDPAETIMIGDRKHDILAAKAHGIATIGVLYGYGSREELTAAGADMLVETPEEILPAILK